VKKIAPKPPASVRSLSGALSDDTRQVSPDNGVRGTSLVTTAFARPPHCRQCHSGQNSRLRAIQAFFPDMYGFMIYPHANGIAPAPKIDFHRNRALRQKIV